MINATRALASTFGAIVGLAGLEHGIGEILQGDVAPAGLLIESWPNVELFRVVAGEPAMTIIPNLLLAGILTVFFSLLFLVCAVPLVEKQNAGLVLVLLSIILLLVGGGIFPPVLGVLTGVLATRIKAPLSWWRAHLSVNVRRLAMSVWPWSFSACVVAWLSLFPGSLILGYLIGVDRASEVVAILILCAFGSLFLTALTGFVRDGERSDRRKIYL